MVVADALAPVRRQGICNNHVDVGRRQISGTPRRNVVSLDNKSNSPDLDRDQGYQWGIIIFFGTLS